MSNTHAHNPAWTLALPIVGAVILALSKVLPGMPGIIVLLAIGLIGSVIAAVHHAEVIAHRVGEPFGTLVLAMAVTIIEVALIVSMMLAGGEGTTGLARDTVFAAVMLILNGIIGVSILAGGGRHRIQDFKLEGMNAALGTLSVIVIFALVLPNFSVTMQGPAYSSGQLLFVALMILVLFAAFTFFQTVRHRDYFLHHPEKGRIADDDDGDVAEPVEPPSNNETLTSLGLLLLALVTVVFSAKAISPTIEAALARVGAPAATIGILIAAIVLLPEGVAAARAALGNRMQVSLNLAMSSAIACIGLTVPAVALVSRMLGFPLELGLDPKSTLLLGLTLFVTAITLRTGRTTVLPGVVHLVLLATYLYFSFVP